jgi:hypothetical protein
VLVFAFVFAVVVASVLFAVTEILLVTVGSPVPIAELAMAEMLLPAGNHPLVVVNGSELLVFPKLTLSSPSRFRACACEFGLPADNASVVNALTPAPAAVQFAIALPLPVLLLCLSGSP